MMVKKNQNNEKKEDEDEANVTVLLDATVKVLSDLHELEKTFSRLRNEAQEMVRKLMSRKTNG